MRDQFSLIQNVLFETTTVMIVFSIHYWHFLQKYEFHTYPKEEALASLTGSQFNSAHEPCQVTLVPLVVVYVCACIFVVDHTYCSDSPSYF